MVKDVNFLKKITFDLFSINYKNNSVDEFSNNLL